MRYNLELTKEELDHVQMRAGTWTFGYKTLNKWGTAIIGMLFAAFCAVVLGGHIVRYATGDIALGEAVKGVVILTAFVVGLPYLIFGIGMRTIDREHSISRKIRRAKRANESDPR